MSARMPESAMLSEQETRPPVRRERMLEPRAGWVTLILGVIQLFAAASLWAGGLFGRIVGIGAAGLSAIAALLSIPAYPLWSLAIFAVDIVIIHQIATRGTEGRRTA